MYRPLEEELTAADEKHIRNESRWIQNNLDRHNWKYGRARICWNISLTIFPGTPRVQISTEGTRRNGHVIVGGARLKYRRGMGAEIYETAARQLEFIKRCQFNDVPCSAT